MMKLRMMLPSTVSLLAISVLAAAFAQEPFGPVIDQVNQKMVKLYGSGGFKGIASYGTGIIISPAGHVLTVAGPMLDTQSLRAHLPDGRRLDGAKVLAIEPVLDLAIVKLPIDETKESLPYFDIAAAAKRPLAQPGDWVLGFSNQFQIATRDEPMTVQRGVIAAYAKLHGRRGVHEAPYQGDVYFVDAITNNPGAAGGALTSRKGELLGIIGKELKNSLTDTWINYAVPLQAKVEVQVEKDQKETIALVDFVDKVVRDGKWRQVVPLIVKSGQKAFHGIVLVPDVVERTPPYVDNVLPNSPAAKAGIRADDLIVYINGEQVGHIKMFNEIMNKIGPGSKISVEVRRGERLRTIELVLQEPAKK